MKMLHLCWLLVNLADVTACMLAVLVLRQKADNQSPANRYLYWLFVGMIFESSIGAISVLIIVVYPESSDLANWFSWLRVAGRAVKAFFVWRFTLYMLNILAPEGLRTNGQAAKEVAEAIKPVPPVGDMATGRGATGLVKPLAAIAETVADTHERVMNIEDEVTGEGGTQPRR